MKKKKKEERKISTKRTNEQLTTCFDTLEAAGILLFEAGILLFVLGG